MLAFWAGLLVCLFLRNIETGAERQSGHGSLGDQARPRMKKTVSFHGIQDMETSPEDVAEDGNQSRNANGVGEAKASPRLGITEMKDLMRRLNFTRSGSTSCCRGLRKIEQGIDKSSIAPLERKVLPLRDAEGVSEEALADGLKQLGYQLAPDELRMLAAQMDPHNNVGAISKSAFLASQLDWHREDLR